MDIVTDLASEAISYITLFQDILKRKLDSNLPDDMLNTTDWVNINENECIKNLTVNQKEKIMDLVWHSLTKADTSSIVGKYFERTTLLLHWLSDSLPALHNTTDNSLKETIKLILYKPPFFWRQTIRSTLYENPKERLELVQILQYMPLQVILAITGKGKLDYMIRLYQFYEKPPLEKSLEKKKTDDYDLLARNDREEHKLFWEISRQEAIKYLSNDNELLKKLKEKEFTLPFETLFRDELIEISEARKCREKEFKIASKDYDFEKIESTPNFLKKEQVFDPLGKAGEMKLMGIALSGGGIRSATFNLGILQRLANLNVLHQFDYISTVSGGGYIGSWFSSWIHRSGSYSKINDRLCPNKSGDPLADEVRPVRWLRMFSNYLSPNVGIMSADAWASGMTWLRNTFINQVVLLLSLLTVLSFISDIYLAWTSVKEKMIDHSQNAVHIFWWSFGMFIIGSFMAAIAMRSFYNINKKKSKSDWIKQAEKFITRFTCKINQTILIPHLIVFWGAVSTLIISTYFAANLPPLADSKEKLNLLLAVFASSFIAFFWVALRGNYHKRWDLMIIGKKNVMKRKPVKDTGLSGKILFAIITSTLVASFVLSFLLMFFWSNVNKIYDWKFINEWGISPDKTFLVISIPIILEIFSIAVILRMALMGNLFPDYRREWWGRMGGYIHRFMLLWILVSFAALIMPRLWETFSAKWIWPAAWSWAGIIGWGVKKAFESRDETHSDTKKYVAVLLRITPFVFMIGVLLIGSSITEKLRSYVFSGQTVGWRNTIITLVLAAITLLLSWRVGVNEFSLHHFYRNRLIRAFLGATRSREERIKTANAFTGFDSSDDILLSSMRTENGYFGPFPLMNSTLNATVVSALDRQDRMGESFVFSPLYCGYDFSPTRSSTYNIDHVYEYGYRPTSQFSNKEGGPTLGTAMAISGAAINPNWGYHSSSTMAFLLTLFNLRLGWWIGNTRLNQWKRPDPKFGLLYLMRDLIGKSDINMEYVCLSDGGHFENMGLYELVRRRCHYILLGDAEQDQEATCEGLANAIRRCRIDFGVEIEIDINQITSKNKHIVTGTILYPGLVPQNGMLVYIKTVITGKEPADIREYALANKDFPQQSTGDQFFDEAQFESYRKLGYYSIKDISELNLP